MSALAILANLPAITHTAAVVFGIVGGFIAGHRKQISDLASSAEDLGTAAAATFQQIRQNAGK